MLKSTQTHTLIPTYATGDVGGGYNHITTGGEFLVSHATTQYLILLIIQRHLYCGL